MKLPKIHVSPGWRLILWLAAFFLAGQVGFALLNVHNTFVVVCGVVLLLASLYAAYRAINPLLREILK